MKMILPAFSIQLLFTGCATTARKQSQTSDLHFLALAIQNYTTAFNGKIPESWKATEMFLQGFERADQYEILAKGSMRDYKDHATTPLVRPKVLPSGGAVPTAFMDGHVE